LPIPKADIAKTTFKYEKIAKGKLSGKVVENVFSLVGRCLLGPILGRTRNHAPRAGSLGRGRFEFLSVLDRLVRRQARPVSRETLGDLLLERFQSGDQQRVIRWNSEPIELRHQVTQFLRLRLLGLSVTRATQQRRVASNSGS